MARRSPAWHEYRNQNDRNALELGYADPHSKFTLAVAASSTEPLKRKSSLSENLSTTQEYPSKASVVRPSCTNVLALTTPALATSTCTSVESTASYLSNTRPKASRASSRRSREPSATPRLYIATATSLRNGWPEREANREMTTS